MPLAGVVGGGCRAADLLPAIAPAPQPVAGRPPRAIEAAAPPLTNSVFVFAGTYAIGNMLQTMSLFDASYVSTHIVGAAYERDLLAPGLGFVIGGEIGVGDRFGDGNSGELWGGVQVRYNGAPLFNILYIRPGVTAGLSYVTNAIAIERQREISYNGNAHLLFYFSPELAFALAQYPNLEIVYRLQHRSGLYGALGHLHEGANASVVGLRYRF
jgi:hypothetical protein